MKLKALFSTTSHNSLFLPKPSWTDEPLCSYPTSLTKVARTRNRSIRVLHRSTAIASMQCFLRIFIPLEKRGSKDVEDQSRLLPQCRLSPHPRSQGLRSFAVLIVSRRPTLCSAWLSVALSPVVPQGPRPVDVDQVAEGDPIDFAISERCHESSDGTPECANGSLRRRDGGYRFRRLMHTTFGCVMSS